VKRIRFRSALLTGVFVAVLAATWCYLAPTRVGGETTYVVTHGISMEPRFHSGDLALVRPAGQYKVGEIVAYHSSLLHLVVLHRIVAIHNGHYTFKGDNNNFLDPVHPTRAELVGRLWVQVPRGGFILIALHNPIVDIISCGLLGLFLLGGVRQKRWRGRRQRKGEAGSGRVGPTIMKPQRETDAAQPVNFGALLTASAVAVAVFLVLAVVAFARPAHKPTINNTGYTQQVSFGYSARVPTGPVYPNGRIKTNDPIFLSIVRQLDFHIAYRFDGAAPSTLSGTEEVFLKLIGPNGWSRSVVLTPQTRFTGGHTSTDVTLDLRHLQSTMAQIGRLTTGSVFGNFSFAIQPVVHIAGTFADRPVNASVKPGLTFQVAGGEVQPLGGSTSSVGGATGSASSQANFTPSQAGDVSAPATAPATISVLGISPEISLLRWIAIIGLVISIAATVFFYLRKRSEPFEETFQIQSQYGHLIVPIVAGEDLGWPPVDVPSIKSLVRLAESGQRLILHTRSDNIDTYLVNDEGTVYRYQVKPSKVIWGEWSETPVQAAA
jgi:signal peptidase I